MADSIIESTYSSLLSSACIRYFIFKLKINVCIFFFLNRKFPDLETYFCYSCNQAEYLFTNHKNKSITMCKSFAEAIWG